MNFELTATRKMQAWKPKGGRRRGENRAGDVAAKNRAKRRQMVGRKDEVIKKSLNLGQIGALISETVFVVVHPNLEDPPLDPNLITKTLHRRVLLPLQPPPHLLRETQHPLLLLRRERRPPPLLHPRGGPDSEKRPHRGQRRRHCHGARHDDAVEGKAMVEGGGGGLALDFLAVEVSVTAACGAFERLECAVGPPGHELAAAVCGTAAEGGRVVLQTFPVRNGGQDGDPLRL
ncbi:hypothetical protein HPP92_002032 [Vanilla planifolia]|uniref:Uncharacterized protein n=1 Tax=Vanilla planifolia TaxID=51239 RepID=A0A835RZD9_VANPL|nr:hypothetical protein HPP92_002032 [Vanilla planifolia]